VRTFSYHALNRKVCIFANVFRSGKIMRRVLKARAQG
jgi:hypothetical protein